MRRTKAWWAKLTSEERAYVCYFERHRNEIIHNDGYLPDDCSECPICGSPELGGGVCTWCQNTYDRLIEKANK